jgi:hypothetical protein
MANGRPSDYNVTARDSTMSSRDRSNGKKSSAGARPHGVKMGRRYKVYAAETGATYQYFFDARYSVVRPEGQGAGSDFVFVVTADQQTPLVLRIFLSDRALEAWHAAHQQALGPNEQYAAAKMRLFRAFDEEERLRELALALIVDETNIEELLAPLELA